MVVIAARGWEAKGWTCPECQALLMRKNGIIKTIDGSKKSKKAEWICPSCGILLKRRNGKLCYARKISDTKEN